MRALYEFEKNLIDRVAESISGEAGVQLRLDARAASAVDCYSDYSKVSFIIDGYERPLYRGQRQFPAEIRAFDSDEEELTLNLYGDSNGRLFELEVIRWGGGQVISPRWDSLSIF
ncbi:hypothetical protein VDF13_20525 [Xanthomonas campestris pv. raphani]|nr:hypothetical protein [Xanthomonas campestris]MEA9652473.1 hypothetical protein [Xanthomonas campestris pv. raphani]MEA9773423.1 hypothetical protein [Xanthomonas campestris pv. raphani]MEA9833839.1 hypothetical protein [Xanthomonas campestris pv. raphani]MEA9955039.1 hypothetical protein [Xanthomonas campestris pv. raphani]